MNAILKSQTATAVTLPTVTSTALSNEAPVSAAAYQQAMMELTPYLSFMQLRGINYKAIFSAQNQHYQNLMVQLSQTLKDLPTTAEFCNRKLDANQAMAYLHYFYGKSDWYITAIDRDSKSGQAFGLIRSACGYITPGYVHINELVETGSNGAQLDLSWEPKTLLEIHKLLEGQTR